MVSPARQNPKPLCHLSVSDILLLNVEACAMCGNEGRRGYLQHVR